MKKYIILFLWQSLIFCNIPLYDTNWNLIGTATLNSTENGFGFSYTVFNLQWPNGPSIGIADSVNTCGAPQVLQVYEIDSAGQAGLNCVLCPGKTTLINSTSCGGLVYNEVQHLSDRIRNNYIFNYRKMLQYEYLYPIIVP